MCIRLIGLSEPEPLIIIRQWCVKDDWLDFGVSERTNRGLLNKPAKSVSDPLHADPSKPDLSGILLRIEVVDIAVVCRW